MGQVEQERSFSLGQLQSMDRLVSDEMLFACGSGMSKGRVGPCSGVLLTDILNVTGVVTPESSDTKKMFVIAASDDGYRTVFSWQELFNSENGQGVMVILEKDGIPICEENGRVDLFSSKDFLTGPRYVKNLKTLEIVKLD